MKQFFRQYATLFLIPLCIIIGIIAYLFFNQNGNTQIAQSIIITTIIIGSIQLITDTIKSIIHKEFALDYIAILAISVGVFSGQYIVAAVIVLMMAWWNTLEKYGLAKAKHSLTSLIDRIPDAVSILKKDGTMIDKKREEVIIWEHIFIKKGEVIPLDGELLSDIASIDESSLTGEPYPRDKHKGNMVSSWTINLGDAITLSVTKVDKDGTYRHIITMVQAAQESRSPLIRLADKYSIIFTVITLIIAAIAYYLHHDMQYVLSVLVIATPCPLILATPIALMGGISSSAKKLIIVKHLWAIEALSRVDSIIFDKTGTLTLWKPNVSQIINHLSDDNKQTQALMSIAATIENSSLHPIASAIVSYAKEHHIPFCSVESIQEIIWTGIVGTFNAKQYRIGKIPSTEGISVGMREEEILVLSIILQDTIKTDSKEIIQRLSKEGMDISIYTGDNAESAQKVADQIAPWLKVVGNCKPEDKQNGINELHTLGKTVAMVGDGINDAPALALADVWLVFSNNEQTATTEAADVVFLAWNLANVLDAYSIAKQSVAIAKQSILFWIGLSTLWMILAALWYIPPVIWAWVQELIDVVAILNAIRATRLGGSSLLTSQGGWNEV